MATEFAQKQYKQRNVLYTCIAIFLVCVTFLSMVVSLYVKAEADATEMLHIQTKQIKDDIHLQMISDRENLATMASFAAKLHRDGESYDLMFESFKPIGLIVNIGILGADDVFYTKAGKMDLGDSISFADEVHKGAYISGRVADLTRADGYELIRSAVPITVNGETVGILYGAIDLNDLGRRYTEMAQTMDAQLFVYNKESGDLVIDTVHEELGNISFLKDRRYHDGSSYEEMMATDKGFTSFESAYRPENMHLHYSTIDDLGWMIAMARYDSQVFAETQALTRTMTIVFLLILAVMTVYVWVLMTSERKLNAVTEKASEIRKILLETSEHKDHIEEALKQMCEFAKARSVFFFDTDGERQRYLTPGAQGTALSSDERRWLNTEMLKYADTVHQNTKSAVNVLCIRPNKHLEQTNPELFRFLNDHGLTELSFVSVVDSRNYTTVVGVLNATNSKAARLLAEKVAVCFSIAFQNKQHLDKTERDATTDGLTGTLNRVAYNHEVVELDREKPLDFACIYVDVNELHRINNTYGHAAGDEMLVYIANTLKEVFYGQKVYRLGGDEFLVLVRGQTPETIQTNLERFAGQLVLKDYHTSVGMAYRTQNTDTLDMVREAEERMYEDKARYYQAKEAQSVIVENEAYVQLTTGIPQIDSLLHALTEEYDGICRVHLDTDVAERILVPAHLGCGEQEEQFSRLMSKYVSDAVEPDYHRSLLSFLNYDGIRRQLQRGELPRILFKKNGGQAVSLSVHKVGETVEDTLWVFAKA